VTATLLWFRQDLRLADNPALHAAVQRSEPVIPVFIWDPGAEGRWAPGGASKWWLHHSLAALQGQLSELGSRLILRQGDTREELRRLREETKADAVYWNRRYEPAVVARDAGLKTELKDAGVEAVSFNSALLFEPHTVQKRTGGPFQVFTPYWRHCLSLPVQEPLSRPAKLGALPARWPASLKLEALRLKPTLRWDAGLEKTWTPGEAVAKKQLQTFLKRSESYLEERDVLAGDAGSRLSPHLHFGEIGPRQIWAGVKKLSASAGVFPAHPGAQKFLSELGWREFAHQLLFHFPDTAERPLNAAFERFPWAEDRDGAKWQAWTRGQTGYPVVDAGMRQLWETGWLPNRVRMIVASFLVKHLRLPWQRGAEWFWDTLVDADLANNTLGWQWVAGCGADAAPYFRIFAPVLQSEKFDPEGTYLRRWVPELANLPSRWIAKPWEAPEDVLRTAGVELGKTYPRPIVDHQQARAAALAAYQSLRTGRFNHE
jgi:deoxyribodipyrimidine photo-lyase